MARTLFQKLKINLQSILGPPSNIQPCFTVENYEIYVEGLFTGI